MTTLGRGNQGKRLDSLCTRDSFKEIMTCKKGHFYVHVVFLKSQRPVINDVRGVYCIDT